MTSLNQHKQQVHGCQQEETVSTTILSLGDGDFSFSLALARCYPSINIVATSILKNEIDVTLHYPHSAAYILTEISAFYPRVQIIYGVDATRLNQNDDIRNLLFNGCKTMSCLTIVFNHPHLGYDSLGNEVIHATRHYSLLAHYFSSARKLALLLSNENKETRPIMTTIHVCLCGTQHTTWKLIEAAATSGLTLLYSSRAEEPFLRSCSDDFVVNFQKHWKAPRKFRNKSLGSVHWLSRYGYTHRKTRVDGRNMAVHDSTNYFFSINRNIDTNELYSISCDSESNRSWRCSICSCIFVTEEALKQHLEAPSNPDNEKIEYKCPKTGRVYKSLYAMEASASNQSNLPKVTSSKQQEKKLKTNIAVENASVLLSRTVSDEHDQKRLRWWARQSTTFGETLHSKAVCDKAIKQRRISVNGEIAIDSSRILHKGDFIELLNIGSTNEDTCVNSPPINIPSGRIMENKKSTSTINSQNIDTSIGTSFILESQEPQQTKAPAMCICIKYETSDIVIAWKPVGIRTCGAFSGSLETEVAKFYMNCGKVEKLYPLSRLEKGCSGLCILAKSRPVYDQLVLPEKTKVLYKFIALVYGTVPQNWDPQQCKTDSGVQVVISESDGQRTERFWSKGGNRIVSTDEMGSTAWHTEPVMARIEVLESCTTEQQAAASNNSTKCLYFSTVRVTCNGRRGRLCGSICNFLRSSGVPVVGDRFSKKEFSLLPRHYRNILKDKLRIACCGIEIMDCSDVEEKRNLSYDDYGYDEKLSAAYWSTKASRRMSKEAIGVV